MKLLLAIIQPNKLQAVREALQNAGIHRLSVLDAQGYGRQKGHSAFYAGVEYQIHLLRKVNLEIFVNDDFVEKAIDTICRVAKTGSQGSIGDGKIFVLPAIEAITIDSGSRGPSSV
ncbi:P-II family nitrogen regulator [Pirellulaceae bacterium SH467]|jgi:nitrogen regulatory protein P-II 1